MKQLALPLVAIGLLIGCGKKNEPEPAPAPKPTESRFQFEDVTRQIGIVAPYQNGRDQRNYAIVESLGGGCASLDFDRDRLIDFFIPGGGTFSDSMQPLGLESTLHRGRNEGWVSVADVAECRTSRFYSHGVATGDVDNDGFPDILLTGYGGLQFFRNLGDGTFEEQATMAGLTDTQWSSSAAWGDLNGDGLVDLYVAHYANWSPQNNPACPGLGPDKRDVCPPREFDPLDDIVYFNQGDGSFSDATRKAGLVTGGKGLGVVIADLDDDRDADIYVANDTTPNFLYRNEGDGRFAERGLSSGTAMDDRGVPNGSMGTAVGDFDDDGLFDLWVTNFEMETFALYHNTGDCQFQHVSRDSGVNAIGARNVGFGTVAEDFDLDGDPDLAVSNGHVIYYPGDGRTEQLPVLLENVGSGRFQKAVPGPQSGYFQTEHVGRGLLSTDFNDDGRPDLIATHLNGTAAFLKNTAAGPNRTLKLWLIGTQTHRDAITTQVRIEQNGNRQIRQKPGGGSYLCSGPEEILIVVPADAPTVSLEIIWPTGLSQKIQHELNTGSAIAIIEGRNMPVQLPRSADE